MRYKNWWYPYINSMVRVYAEGKGGGERAEEIYRILSDAMDNFKPEERAIIDKIKKGCSYAQVAKEQHYSIRHIQRIWNKYINTVGTKVGI